MAWKGRRCVGWRRWRRTKGPLHADARDWAPSYWSITSPSLVRCTSRREGAQESDSGYGRKGGGHWHLGPICWVHINMLCQCMELARVCLDQCWCQGQFKGPRRHRLISVWPKYLNSIIGDLMTLSYKFEDLKLRKKNQKLGSQMTSSCKFKENAWILLGNLW